MLDIHQLHGPHFGPVDLHLSAGELLCLYGPSGAGKSQLLRAIADLDPHEGEVLLAGVAQRTVSPTAWRRQVAYLPAESGWWAARVGEHFSAMPTPEMLARLGLGIAILDREIEDISSGERQRLGLLRLLGQQPRVVLLDEPSANLDPDSARLMEDCVRGYLEQHQAAAIWVSHDPAQRARIANRTMELHPKELACN
ncbi:MAG: ATP-binding cassette domain-containing protein [Pseudomonadota bacterium]